MNNKVTAIITAGGSSVRFGSNKLLEKLNNITVIETTILKFIDIVNQIIIPSGEMTKEYILKSKLFPSDKIKFAPAGATRQESVYNAINLCTNTDIVLIHDGARPYISKETILETINLAKKYKAVVVGKMATDTIKIVQENKIIKTLDRKTIFHAETPQAFDFDLIKKIHIKYANTGNFTDDSSMVEAEGIQPYIFISKENNKKITTKSDLF